jgi:hypothetical protein
MTQRGGWPLARALCVCLLVGMFLGARSASGASCAAPDDISQCSTLCSSSRDCIACCTSVSQQATQCKRSCLLIRPSRPTSPGAQAAAGNLTANCRLLQAGGRVSITLRVQNTTGVMLKNVSPASPSLQADANTEFDLGAPRPTGYLMLRAGSFATFMWRGALRSDGAVGIAMSVSGTDPTGATISMPLVDCGTVTATQRSRHPVRPARPGPARPSTGGSSPPAAAQTEAQQCAACHENPKQAFVAAKWSESGHANSYGTVQGNTYCAQCHSPFQADANATKTNNQPIPTEQWQAVTCSVCHPPQEKMTEWGSPIALYDIATKTYSPLALADANILCLNCHNGSLYAPKFGDAGLLMMQTGVRCIDCHMSQITSVNRTEGQAAAHDFKVEANLPSSCGLGPGGCHGGNTNAWAVNEIRSGAIHPNR